MTDSSVPRAVPSAVAPSTGNSVPVNTQPTRESRITVQGGERNPVVPKTPAEGIPGPQPGYAGTYGAGSIPYSGEQGAPTVPDMNGLLFRKGPADEHYSSESEGNVKPYGKVNNPAVQGRFNWFKTFINGIGLGVQNREPTGWNVREPQQRTSVWRPLMPQHGPGFGAYWYEPRQLPQSVRYNRDFPVTGSDPYGTGVLNADTFGAGQTAGGIGGNRYTPPPGPPPTTSTASQPQPVNSMPTWG